MSDNKNNEDKLHYLSATNEANISKYKDTLDKLFDPTNKNAKNIAISGSYGSGKSSVIESYKNETNQQKNFTHIIFGSFSDKNDTSQNQLEKHIITQIIYQTPKEKLYESAFTIKKPINDKTIKLYTSLIIYCLFVLFFDIYILSLDTLVFNYKASGFWNTFNLYYREAILNFFMFIILANFLYIFIKTVKTKGIIKSLKLKDIEFDMFDMQTESFIDKYLSELLFLFEISTSRIFVFEDLDRFNNTEIFEKLRELNFLLNSNTDEEETYKFVYLVRDDLFKNTNRVKFFDFVVPIIPIIDSTNSKDMLKEFTENEFSYKYITLISIYIDDLRLLKNIINEYKIYKNQAHQKEKENLLTSYDDQLSREQLFSLMVYKNLFPIDFIELQQKTGVLHYLLNSRDALIEPITKEYIDKITELTNQKNKLSSYFNAFLKKTLVF